MITAFTFSILQAQQLYTAGIPLLEAYLLPMASNRTPRNERLSAASHVSKFIHMRIFREVKKMADLSHSRMPYKQKTLYLRNEAFSEKIA